MATFSANVINDPHSVTVQKRSTLALTAEARRKRILPYQNSSGDLVYLELPRGIHLHDHDWLHVPELNLLLAVVPAPEPVVTVTGKTVTDLLKASYHLGNRHVPLQISEQWLRLQPDPVIEDMLKDMGLQITTETVPFYPETGAYHHHH